MQYLSKNTTLYASETVLLKMCLRKRNEQSDLSETDIVLEVVTGQLGPRRYVSSFYKNPNDNSTPGARIMRRPDFFLVQLSPQFLQTLQSGFLTITAHYKTKSGFITNRVRIRRFVNDMPIAPYQPTEGENAACSFVSKLSSVCSL